MELSHGTPVLLRYAVIARVLGVLLLAAAALKVQGLGFDPVRRLGIFAAPEFQVAVVEFEVFLGLWLLSGFRPLGSWFLALSAFVAFAGVSFYLGWVGQSSCGCFGRLSPSPWYTFGLDVGIIAALFVARPDLGPLKDKRRSTLTAAVVPAVVALGGGAVFFGLFIGLAYFTFGSVRGAVAYFRGERVSVLPRLLEGGGRSFRGAPQGQNRVGELDGQAHPIDWRHRRLLVYRLEHSVELERREPCFGGLPTSPDRPLLGRDWSAPEGRESMVFPKDDP